MIAAKGKLLLQCVTAVFGIHTCIACIDVYIPDFWFLCEGYLDGLGGLKQTSNFIHTKIFGKLKLENLEMCSDKNVCISVS